MPIAYGPVTAKLKRHKIVSEKSSEANQVLEISQKPENDEYVSLIDRLANNVTDKNPAQKSSTSTIRCFKCNKIISDDIVLKCISEKCPLVCHMICFAKFFLKTEPPYQLLPVEAPCPLCNISLLWGDLIREAHGFRHYLSTKEYEET